MRLFAQVAFAVCALAAALPVLADSHSVSYSDWTIAGDLTTLKFVLPEIEARRLTGVDVPLATTKKLGEYLLAHVAVEGDGENCAPIDQGYDIGLIDPLAVGAGSFGFEDGHYDVSMKVGELVLLPAVRQAPLDTLIIADGFSCRTQIEQATGRRALHLADVLEMAAREGPDGPAGSYPERTYVPDHATHATKKLLIRSVLVAAAASLAYLAYRTFVRRSSHRRAWR